MTPRTINAALAAVFAVVVATGVSVSAQATGDRSAAIPVNATQGGTEKLDISAFAINMGNVGNTGANASVRITINSWTTAEQRSHLISTMVEKNGRALLSELQKQPSHGKFSIPGLVGPDPHSLRLGNDLRYTWQTPLPNGGRRIVIITDRYIGFGEARYDGRSMDYPFTLFEMRVDASGKGEGKMAVATMIKFDREKNTVEVENYGSEPVRLNNLTVTVAK